MHGKLSVEMTRGDLEALDAIAAQTGFPREAAALYAVRLVAACIREGLLGDEMSAAWPAQAISAGAGDGRVITFPARRRMRGAARGKKVRQE